MEKENVLEIEITKINDEYSLAIVKKMNRKVITKNLGKYGTTGLWTMVMEILED